MRQFIPIARQVALAAPGFWHRSSDTAERIARLRRLAWILDALGRVPGTRFRFGINSVIGLAPVVGDGALVLISLYIVWEARELGVPRPLLVRMIWNVVVEGVLGAVPLLGDLFDVVWKANLRNVAIIERHFAGRRSG